MAPPEADALATRGDVRASVSDRFAWLRTRMSAERTLMSWARTGTALIGFGFTIAQFLSRLNAASEQGEVAPPRYPDLPFVLGQALIAVGTVGLAFACLEYAILVRYLRDRFPELAGVAGLPRYTPTLTASLTIVAVGLITFVVMMIRI